MTSTDFLIRKLQDVFVKFPKSTIRYEYRSQRNSHVIEVMPREIFESDDYIDSEIELCDAFGELFPDENLIFISEGDLNKITIPTLILNNVSICFKNNELVTEPIFKNLNHEYTTVRDGVFAFAA